MTLNAVFTAMYGQCTQDWIATQLLQQCLPSWVRKDGTYDYEAAEFERAAELSEAQFNNWSTFEEQYMRLARKRYAIHLRKLKLVLRHYELI